MTLDENPASTVQPLGDAQVAAYLERIGITSLPADGPAALRVLHVRHLQTVPFENLSIHLGEPVSLSTDALFDKIVARRRGGFCYELNGLFASLLCTLGYDVALLAGAVWGPRGYGPPFDHLALLVNGSLVDVGFGRHSAYPLRLEPEIVQPDPGGVFTVSVAAGGDIAVMRDGRPQYRLEMRPRALSDFAPTCWWQQTRPGSHFRTGPVCSLVTEAFGSITLADHTLVATAGANREESTIVSDDDVLAAYRDNFGIVLDRLPVAAGS